MMMMTMTKRSTIGTLRNAAAEAVAVFDTPVVLLLRHGQQLFQGTPGGTQCHSYSNGGGGIGCYSQDKRVNEEKQKNGRCWQHQQQKHQQQQQRIEIIVSPATLRKRYHYTTSPPSGPSVPRRSTTTTMTRKKVWWLGDGGSFNDPRQTYPLWRGQPPWSLQSLPGRFLVMTTTNPLPRLYGSAGGACSSLFTGRTITTTAHKVVVGDEEEDGAATTSTTTTTAATAPKPHRPNAFETLGLDPRFDLDLKELKQRYLTLMSRHHPDRRRHSDDDENEQQQQEASAITHAYDQLRNPHQRAVHLLEVLGHPLPQSNKSSGAATPSIDMEFLSQVMSIREQIDAVIGIHDDERYNHKDNDDHNNDKNEKNNSSVEKEEQVTAMDYALQPLWHENRQRLTQTCQDLQQALETKDFHQAHRLTAYLQYWNRIDETLRENFSTTMTTMTTESTTTDTTRR